MSHMAAPWNCTLINVWEKRAKLGYELGQINGMEKSYGQKSQDEETSLSIPYNLNTSSSSSFFFRNTYSSFLSDKWGRGLFVSCKFIIKVGSKRTPYNWIQLYDFVNVDWHVRLQSLLLHVLEPYLLAKAMWNILQLPS